MLACDCPACYLPYRPTRSARASLGRTPGLASSSHNMATAPPASRLTRAPIREAGPVAGLTVLDVTRAIEKTTALYTSHIWALAPTPTQLH
jgi:hypothetical protein